MDNEKITRRGLLSGAGQAALGLGMMGAAGLTPVYGAQNGRAAHDYGVNFGEEAFLPKRVSAQEKVNIALIGCGGQGMSNLNTFIARPDVNVVAVCDPDSKHMGKAAITVEDKTDKAPEQIKDFRKLLERKDIDLVINATPDHWHALIAISAFQAGKDIFTEKPISHDILEGRQMVNHANKLKRVVQVGTWQRSLQQFLDATAYVRSGKLGKINLCRAWKVQDPNAAVMGKQTTKPVPSELDYDLWVGPAAMVPYQDNRCHYKFRWYFNFAGGMTGDWGVHMIDTVLQGMNATDDFVMPTKVMSLGGKFFTGADDDRTTPDTQIALIEFPGWMLQWEVHVGNTKTGPNGLAGSGVTGRDHGALFIGSQGSVLVDRSGWSIFDAAGNPVEKPAPIDMGQKMSGLPAHVAELIASTKSRGTTRANIASMHKTTTVCHLANLAYQAQNVLHWDAAKEIVTNDPKAMKNLSYQREYRKGWTLPKA
ncbi:MAG: Gfo/Idh/MocA family oxidoreductase [Armatimonadetes bacterium]|nr:Gfo/Idh/MocA family oxidoreductase [Armatimonadota bacterium]